MTDLIYGIDLRNRQIRDRALGYLKNSPGAINLDLSRTGLMMHECLFNPSSLQVLDAAA
jgi:hypothetical protein